MRVGTVCFNTRQGIAHLAYNFYAHGIIDRVMTVKHPHYTSYPERYDKDYQSVNEFLDGLDALLLFETALDRNVIRQASRIGIKIVLMPMYEYTPHPFPVQVDLCLCPSLLDLQVYQKHYNSIFLPVPVDREWKLRETALRFIHNAGHGQYQYAKGTPELIEAMQYVKSDITLLVRGQPCGNINRLFDKHRNSARIKFVIADLPDDELYNPGDVFVYPEKYNGLSLPLQEAYASGMVVMTTDRFPANTWLPKGQLIPIEGTEDIVIRGGSGFTLKNAIINPRVIAQTIDNWYGRDIVGYSTSAKLWASQNSWSVLKPKYLEALEQICR